MSIKVVPLGAGQDVGRSCVIVTLGRKNIMFDCGMHMGYNDERRFPDFNFISRTGQYTQNIYCVIISHLYVSACLLMVYLFVCLFNYFHGYFHLVVLSFEYFWVFLAWSFKQLTAVN